jgi:aminoglycoside phosphotransferase (APT) family kinase protein
MENLDQKLVNAIFAFYGITGQWSPMLATGVANYIYATEQVVLRIATDYHEAISDARTESIAAPVAYAAGILTPRLIAFDDSRTLIDRPFSLWERVQGQTFGLLDLDHNQSANLWRQVGHQLFRLHARVKVCKDPNGYLDTPERETELYPLLNQLVGNKRINETTAKAIADLISELTPYIKADVDERFTHNDIHVMNIMCSATGELLAIIDWGDAGWGDPTSDFAAIPLSAISYSLEGYKLEAPGSLGVFPEARIIWDKLYEAMEETWENPAYLIPLDTFRQFLQSRANLL